jgi:putative ABC transport system permease protein
LANLAAANMLHRKTRTVVSVLGIAIQVATVMILVGLVNGTVDGISARLASVGADVLFQPPDASLILGSTHSVIPTSLAADMKSQVPAVTEVTPVLNRHIAQLHGRSESVNLWAVDYPSYARISGGLTFVEGRAIAGPFELDIDTILQGKYGFRVGEEVEMLGRPFRIVGISHAGTGGRILARLEDIGEVNGTPGMASFFLVKGASSRDAGDLVIALQKAFPGYTITAISQMSEQLQRTAMGLREFRTATTGVAVLLSFLVVLLAMYTAIVERTREISILRAMGATQGWVVRLLLRESVLLCLAGIVVGFLLAFFGRSLLTSAFPAQEIHFTRGWAAIAAGLGLGGGFLGALYPALRAARMDPLRTLNFE